MYVADNPNEEHTLGGKDRVVEGLLQGVNLDLPTVNLQIQPMY